MTGNEGAAPSTGARLDALLAAANLAPLDAATTARFEAYLALLLRWNAKMNLTAIRDDDGIVARHFVESIACAQALPTGIKTLLDFGSGAGFPGIPIALCRPEMAVTLAERQMKKAAFLREALRTVGIAARVQEDDATKISERFDCVTLRAVDRMADAVAAAGGLLRGGGWLAVLTSKGEIDRVRAAAGPGFQWRPTARLPGGEERLLILGSKATGE